MNTDPTTNEIDYDDMRWQEMTGRMDALTEEEKAAYKRQYDQFQEAAQEEIDRWSARMDAQENEFQM